MLTSVASRWSTWIRIYRGSCDRPLARLFSPLCEPSSSLSRNRVVSRLSARFPVLKWRSRPLAKSLDYNSRDTETLIILKNFQENEIFYTENSLYCNWSPCQFFSWQVSMTMLDRAIRISFILENVTYFSASKQYNTQLSSFAMLFVPVESACSGWNNAFRLNDFKIS